MACMRVKDLNGQYVGAIQFTYVEERNVVLYRASYCGRDIERMETSGPFLDQDVVKHLENRLYSEFEMSEL